MTRAVTADQTLAVAVKIAGKVMTDSVTYLSLIHI